MERIDFGRIIDFIKKTKDGKKIEETLSLLENDPDNTTIRLKLADLYLRVGYRQSAIPEYQKAAQLLQREGFTLKAISVYKKLLSLGGMSLNGYRALAALYTEEGRLAEARRMYEAILRIEPEDHDAQEAIDGLDQGKIPSSSQAKTASPDDLVPAGDSLLLYEYSQESQGDNPSEEHLDERIVRDVDLDELSHEGEEQGEDLPPNGSVDVEITPESLGTDDDTEIVSSLDEEESDPDLSAPGELVPDVSIEDLDNDTLSGEEDTETASPQPPRGHTDASAPVDPLEAETKPSDGDSDLHYHLGVAYREMGLADKAIDEFAKALKQGTKPLECLTMLARCHADKGLSDEAVGFLHRALKLENLTQDQIDLLQQQIREVAVQKTPD
jgi:tetratricopeptide (TPR) repeat protein